MAEILRGDVVWADLQPAQGREQSGRRPVLVLSHDVFNQRSGTVIAVALTSHPPRAGFPLTLELADKRLPKQSWVKIAGSGPSPRNVSARESPDFRRRCSTRSSRVLTKSSDSGNSARRPIVLVLELLLRSIWTSARVQSSSSSSSSSEVRTAIRGRGRQGAVHFTFNKSPIFTHAPLFCIERVAATPTRMLRAASSEPAWCPSGSAWPSSKIILAQQLVAAAVPADRFRRTSCTCGCRR